MALFGQAVAWLRRHRVLLPGVSVLARLVTAVRAEAADRLRRTVAEAAAVADADLPARLRALLDVPPGQRVSGWEQLRRAPVRTSGPGLERALTRAAEVISVGAGRADLSGVPASRLSVLARYGLTAKAPLLRDLADPRGTATLVAAARHLEASAVDDALDLFDLLMATRLIAPARRASERERLAALPRLERASVTLAGAVTALLDVLAAADADAVGVADAWRAVEQVAPRDRVREAAAVVGELVPDDSAGEAAMRAALAGRYRVVRPFLVLLSEALPLDAAPAGQKILAAVRTLPDLAARRVRQRPLSRNEIDADLVPPVWGRAVYGNRDLSADAVDRDAYVLCVLEQLRAALRRRDIFAAPSLRWADPRAMLLHGPAWEAVRPEITASLGLAGPAEEHLRDLARSLDTAWREMTRRLAAAGPEASVRIVPAEGDRVRLSVERLDAVGEPESLKQLREMAAAMLPGSTCPTCCWKFTPGPATWTPTPTRPGPWPAWRTCRSRSPRCW